LPLFLFGGRQNPGSKEHEIKYGSCTMQLKEAVFF
jgi:hypothetical protein